MKNDRAQNGMSSQILRHTATHRSISSESNCWIWMLIEMCVRLWAWKAQSTAHIFNSKSFNYNQHCDISFALRNFAMTFEFGVQNQYRSDAFESSPEKYFHLLMNKNMIWTSIATGMQNDS